MNKRLHAGAVALGCLGLVLVYAGWLGWRGASPAPWVCGDETCEEAHP